ncbi:MAG TPA: peptidylprolyl isomerase [Thermoanaerobaculia bacterium]|nr:peptidylprolyl isomerase [Thermoanaerobaculia bacterium]
MSRAAVVVLVGGLALAAGCQREAPPAPDVAARIGDTDVRYAEFETYVERVAGDAESGLAGGVLSQLFDQFVDEQLLERLAADRGLAKGAQGGRRAVDGLLAAGLAAPSEQEVARFYSEHRREFARPERVRLRQILTEDRAAAERARTELAAGADFAQVARQVARDPGARSVRTSGDQGELARHELPRAFADVIFSLAPGEVSGVVPAGYGFHVFQVTARLPAEVVPLDQARREILQRLRRERADRELARLVGESRRQYTVTVYERNLPFEYEGAYRHEHAETRR